jgi:hypothetical protein
MQSNNIGNRRELFVDTQLIDGLTGHIHQHLHTPIDRGIVVDHDAPWEGTTSGYNTTLKDGDRFRMYYRGWDLDENKRKEDYQASACVAESSDGITWTKPNLGLFSHNGSTDNNIILETDHLTHNFVPFIDTNPDAAYKYRGVGRGHADDIHGLFAMHSADGLRWESTYDGPMKLEGRFDSQNLAFWDPICSAYRIYFRDMERDHRAIKTATSPDFVTWSESTFLTYEGSPADTHLYTNQIEPYYRAPHLYVGFPTRFIQDRGQITEGLFMSSRDAVHFTRYEESFIRPGLNPNKWGNRCNYTWCGLLETASDIEGSPPEISLFTDENYYTGQPVSTRRHTVRLDGFVSMRAGMSGGEVTTKPITFSGSKLEVNVSTSAAGSMRVAILDESEKEIEGYGLEDSDEFFGDSVEHTLTWKGASDVSRLEGKPVRLRIVLHDADVYSFKFS